MDVSASAALTVTWVIAVDPGSDPPVLGTSSPASPETASAGPNPHAIELEPVTAWALTPV
jgi:hypothetical protein